MRDPYLYKSAIPAVESKFQQVIGFRNDSAKLTENKLTAKPHSGKSSRPSINVNENTLLAKLDANDKGKMRAQAYAVKRNSDTYKIARAEAKRARQAKRQFTGGRAKCARPVGW